MTEAALADRVAELCPSRSSLWAENRAQKIREAAMRNPFQRARHQSHLFSLNMYIQMVLQYQEHLSALQKQIDALAMEIEEYKIIQSIPGIGGKIAATIISENRRDRSV